MRSLFCLLATITSSEALKLCGSTTKFFTRRTAANALAGATASILTAAPAHAEKSRTDGYEVQRSEREWAYVLSGQQYFILRQGGTERPNTSPLYTEKRPGTFKCAACNSALFSSEAKFNSGTGWYVTLRAEPP